MDTLGNSMAKSVLSILSSPILSPAMGACWETRRFQLCLRKCAMMTNPRASDGKRTQAKHGEENDAFRIKHAPTVPERLHLLVDSKKGAQLLVNMKKQWYIAAHEQS